MGRFGIGVPVFVMFEEWGLISGGTPWVTSGTQKWKGAIPNLMINASIIIIGVKWFCGLIIVHWPESRMLSVIAIIKIIDAVACVKKYLVVASVDHGVALWIKIGMMASIFISRPIHMVNQWELNTVIIVPRNRVNKMIGWGG